MSQSPSSTGRRLLGAGGRFGRRGLSAGRRSDWRSDLFALGGFYAGAVYGAGLYPRSAQAKPRRASASAWGQTSGAVLGYSFQSGRYVYGPEGDASANYHLLRPLNEGAHAKPVAERRRYAPADPAPADAGRLRSRRRFSPTSTPAASLSGDESMRRGIPSRPTIRGRRREVTGVTLGAGLEWRFDAPVLGPLVLRGEYIIDVLTRRRPSRFIPASRRSAPRTSSNSSALGLISYTDPDVLLRRASLSGWNLRLTGYAYAGVLGGAQWAQLKTTLVGGATSSMSASGAAAGVMTGRNFMLGSFVVGYEGALAASDTTATGPQAGRRRRSTYRNYFDAELRPAGGICLWAVPALCHRRHGLGPQRRDRSGKERLSRSSVERRRHDGRRR